jgi:hypothetical protein
MTLPFFMAGSIGKLKTSITGSRTSHPDACISFLYMPHPLHKHIAFSHVTDMLGEVQTKHFLCPNPTPMHTQFPTGSANK